MQMAVRYDKTHVKNRVSETGGFYWEPELTFKKQPDPTLEKKPRTDPTYFLPHKIELSPFSLIYIKKK